MQSEKAGIVPAFETEGKRWKQETEEEERCDDKLHVTFEAEQELLPEQGHHHAC
jgi:hypothetical protein